MIIYTIGFTKKRAEDFFQKLSTHNIEIVIDIRRNNNSQLSGFSKGDDLKFFLKKILDCDYKHELKYAPTKELLDNYKKNICSWEEYETIYNEMINYNKCAEDFKKKFNKYCNVCLLCSENEYTFCHRRLFAEYLEKNIGNITICHLL